MEFVGVSFVFLPVVVFGFNVDTHIPIIKYGDRNSYFGFSLAIHQFQKDRKNVFLVGAPLANVSNVSNIYQPGSIYSCELSTARNCLQIALNSYSVDENSGQWLGVIVQSQLSGKVVTCAHRYRSNKRMLGNCYLFNNALDPDNQLQPNSADSGDDHTGYGSAQLGMSAAFLPNQKIVIGAPGVKNWRGTVFSKGLNFGEDFRWIEGLKIKMQSYSYLGYSITSGRFDGISEKHMHVVLGAPRSAQNGSVVIFIQGVNSITTTPQKILTGEQIGSSFGYSVAAVDLNNDTYDDLVVGAPFYLSDKGKVGGAIYVFMGRKNEINSFDVKWKRILSRKMLEKECEELQCEHARFGLAIAGTGDLNLDGYNDIVVGAPYEGDGAIYIFHGSADGIVEPFSQRIYASAIDKRLKTFGYSLASGVDMDGNGYPDIVVGAFDSDAAVFLYSRPIITLIPNITISPMSININDTKFCAQDGSPHQCIIIRLCLKFTAKPKKNFMEKPKINYTIIAEKFDPRVVLSRVVFRKDMSHIKRSIIELENQSKDQYKCETNTAYLKDSFRDKQNPIKFQFSYELADVQKSTTSGLPKIGDYPILDVSTAEETTEVRQVDIIKDCGKDNICQSNLHLQAVVDLNKDSDGYPVLQYGIKDTLHVYFIVTNTHEPAYDTKLHLQIPPELQYQGIEHQLQFVDCAAKKNTTYILCDKLGNPFTRTQMVNFTIKLNTRSLKSSQNNITIRAWLNTTSNQEQVANTVRTLFIKVLVSTDIRVQGTAEPEQILYNGEVRGESAVAFEDDIGPAVNHTYEVFNNGPGEVQSSYLYIYWPYELKSDQQHGKHLLYLMQSPEVIKGKAECINPQDIVNPAKIRENRNFIIRSRRFSLESLILLEKREELKLASYRGAEAHNNDWLNRQANWTRVCLDWHRYPLLHALEKTKMSSDHVLYGPSQGGETVRRRRAAPRAEQITAERQRKRSVMLGCETTAKCKKIQCNLGLLKSKDSVVIIIRARLWESTLLEDYRNVDEVSIKSTAEIIIDSSLIKQTNLDNDKGKAVTSAIPDIDVARGPGVSWWIILVAIIIGLLLLLLIGFIFWKCGFFKRKRRDEMKTYEAIVEKKDNED